MAPSPPSLPPSVEEAYRRKCLQLKQRMAEVEETNDAARVRLARLKRQVEKQRLERAFLLEQLARRTSTNVEDSDGSPSPPPTPKDKPLRTKRGHRKASLTGAGEPGSAAATFVGQHAQAQSPGSDAFSAHVDSQTHGAPSAKSGKSKSKAKDDGSGNKAVNGTAGASKRAANGFELYCAEARPALAEKKQAAAASKAKKAGSDDDDDAHNDEADVDMADDEGAVAASVEAELAQAWKVLSEAEKDEFEARAKTEARRDKNKADSEEKKDGADEADGADDVAGKQDKAGEPGAAAGAAKNEDTEMADGDTGAAPTPADDKE